MSLDVITRFIGDSSSLEAGAKKATDAIGGISPAALLAGGAVVAGVGIAVTAIVGMTQAAAEDEAQQAKLEAAIRAAGAATGDYKKQVDDAIAAGQARAFTDTQTRDALQSLVTATGDVGTATTELSAAQDIARFAGVDLATAADAVAKAHAGQDGALRKLIPGLEKGKTSTDTLAAAQAAAAGSADAYASSTEGSLAVASDAFGELGETIGSAFLPLVKAILPPLIKIIGFMGTLIEAIIPPLAVLFGALGTAIGLVLDQVIPLVTFVGTLIGQLVQRLRPILDTLAGVFDTVAGAIGGMVRWLQQLIDWVGRTLDSIAKLLDSLNPLKGFTLPSLPFTLAAPAAAGVGGAGSSRSAGGRSAAPAGGVTVNVYGGDPRRITEAVAAGWRRWVELNGRTAPTRDY